tara:strand:- start:329 stop:1123 length:795 start_codon:yes stop_codon:yes gene_type:complete
MHKNFISILITNYNKGKFLNKSLKTVCNQNFKNYEIIIFDDSSTDDSINIIQKYKKVKLIINKSNNKKKSSPLNQIKGILKCVKKSKGNIICLLDADDYFKKNKLKKIDQFFQKQKNLNCVFDVPLKNLAQFNFKEKIKKYSIWPTIFPTSCISLRRTFIIDFLKNVNKSDFPHLEIDARLTIFSKFYMNEYNIIRKKLTYYSYDPNGITANIKKFSSIWWIRRSEAFSYLRIIMKKKQQSFIFSFDYYLTNFLTFLFKKILKL